MNRQIRLGAAAVLALVCFAPPVLAGAPAGTTANDPNQKVCQDIIKVGSRIGGKRICATRAEWAEMRKQDREVVDEAQRSAHIGCSAYVAPGHGSSPAC